MRLIDADKLIETLRDTVFEYGDTGGSWGSFMPDVCAIVREEPEVDPVKHGRWVRKRLDMECSCCNTLLCQWAISYCSNCGAKMDEVTDDTD